MQPNSKFLLNMETKDELLSEGEKYFEKVMQDFNQNRKSRNLRKHCNDEGIDYKWLSEYKRTTSPCSHVITKHQKYRSRNVHNA